MQKNISQESSTSTNSNHQISVKDKDQRIDINNKRRIVNNSDNDVQRKFNIVVPGDSLLNGGKEKGLSENHNVRIKNYPGATSEKIIEKVDDFMKKYQTDFYRTLKFCVGTQ